MCKAELEAAVAECVGWPFAINGRGKGGIDCFGLFLYLQERVGNALPDIQYPDAEGEREYGRMLEEYGENVREIRKEEMVAGDVIMFETRPGRLCHLGIYMGGGKFVHATRESGVVVARLGSQPYVRQSRAFFRVEGKR